jgi:hypothetical protein
MKNSNAMAAGVSQPTATAMSPRAGKSEASPTVSSMAARKRSMRDQRERSRIMVPRLQATPLISAVDDNCEQRILMLL